MAAADTYRPSIWAVTTVSYTMLLLRLPNGQTFEARATIVTIGRVPGNDIVLADPRISSRHSRLIRRGASYVYEDLKSRNGSLIERDGQRVPNDGTPTQVQPGDRLMLGDLVDPVVVEIAEAPRRDAFALGATVVAQRAVSDARAGFEQVDAATLRALFALLEQLSGRVEPEVAISAVLTGAQARFQGGVGVALRAPEGGWTVAESRNAREPSQRLMQQAIKTREVVTYVAGDFTPTVSILGLDATVLVPLLAGDEAIGVLYTDGKNGASDLGWLSIVATHLAAVLAIAHRFRMLCAENDQLRERQIPRPIIGRSPAILQTMNQLRRVGKTETTVLVLGETGTGKELAARALHAYSRRCEGPFAAINCAALSETLLNSELFGHQKGAFTGAIDDRKGLFEAAAGGTVFLDEIGEVSTAVQVRLLRVLQEREVKPVGALKPRPIDVRIIAATNLDLVAEVAAGRFREDLYYRLAVFPIELPPLRDRGADVEILAERFREHACARHQTWVGGFTTAAMAALRGYRWPGNIRQLEHEIERAVILAGGSPGIDLEHLSPKVSGQSCEISPTGELPRGQLKVVMAALEERMIRRCLDEHEGNRTQAAKSLGISRQALQVKLARWRDR